MLKRIRLQRRLQRLTKEREDLLWEIREEVYKFHDLPPRSLEFAEHQKAILTLERQLAANADEIRRIGEKLRQA